MNYMCYMCCWSIYIYIYIYYYYYTNIYNAQINSELLYTDVASVMGPYLASAQLLQLQSVLLTLDLVNVFHLIVIFFVVIHVFLAHIHNPSVWNSSAKADWQNLYKNSKYPQSFFIPLTTFSVGKLIIFNLSKKPRQSTFQWDVRWSLSCIH